MGKMQPPDLDESLRPPPPSPEGVAWFRAALEELEWSQMDLVRFMERRGDDRKRNTILRSVQRAALGEARISGELRVVINMLLRSKRRKLARRAAAPREAA